MSLGTAPCPGRCGRVIPAAQPMCGHCWARVPKSMRRMVHRTLLAWSRDVSDPDRYDDYLTAVRIAKGSL